MRITGACLEFFYMKTFDICLHYIEQSEKRLWNGSCRRSGRCVLTTGQSRGALVTFPVGAVVPPSPDDC